MSRHLSLPLALLFLTVPRLVLGAACCMGSGPTSFILLQDLEDIEVGLSSSIRDVYGWYNPYGELEETEKNQTYTLSFGAGKRLGPDLALSLTVPLIYQSNGLGLHTTSRAALGDVLIGGQYTLYRSLFQDEWTPTVLLLGGLKAPTGMVETVAGRRYLPGTSDGLWSPYVGFTFQKSLRQWQLFFSGTWAPRFPRDGYSDGNRVDLIETVSYVFSRRFSLAASADESWLASTIIGGKEVADSAGRAIDVSLTPTYFLTQVFSVAASFTVTLPVGGWGVNHQAARGLTFMTRYGFF